MSDTFEYLKKRILVLNEHVWEGQLSWTKIERWLDNFTGDLGDPDKERLHALFWLSQFMYFGSKEIRVLLRALYRDLFLYPLIQELRMANPTASQGALSKNLDDELKKTRFLGVGNPSESGVHLLYYFRQENLLPKTLFIDSVQIFQRAPQKKRSLFACGKSAGIQLRDRSISRYIFLDDVCGSGNTAIDYSDEVIEPLLRLNPQARAAYYCLFASGDGLNAVRQQTLFRDNCAAIYELDEGYRSLSGASRYLKSLPADIDQAFACQLVETYGLTLWPDHSCGYEDGQLLLGFHHNTPDNTLPIIWSESPSSSPGRLWNPIFKRYRKIYGVNP